MKYDRFEDLPVWQDGIELTARIFRLTRDPAFRGQGDLANQLQRAGLSVPNNVAEGFERGSTQELITFLYYSRGSAGEVRSALHVADRLEGMEHLKSEISDLRSGAESISRQLRAWADSLQNSEIRGQRYLTDKTRHLDDQKKRADAFLQRLKRMDEERRRRQSAEDSPPSKI